MPLYRATTSLYAYVCARASQRCVIRESDYTNGRFECRSRSCRGETRFVPNLLLLKVVYHCGQGGIQLHVTVLEMETYSGKRPRARITSRDNSSGPRSCISAVNSVRSCRCERKREKGTASKRVRQEDRQPNSGTHKVLDNVLLRIRCATLVPFIPYLKLGITSLLDNLLQLRAILYGNQKKVHTGTSQPTLLFFSRLTSHKWRHATCVNVVVCFRITFQVRIGITQCTHLEPQHFPTVLHQRLSECPWIDSAPIGLRGKRIPFRHVCLRSSRAILASVCVFKRCVPFATTQRRRSPPAPFLSFAQHLKSL